MKKLELRYGQPAPMNIEGWEKYSLPIGNGYFGASVFGGIEDEEIQFTTNEYANDYPHGGVSSFSEIHIAYQPQNSITDYLRSLSLQTGCASSSFFDGGNRIQRECFCSYPDHCFAYSIETNQPVDLKIGLVISYLGKRSIEDGGREGKVYFEKNVLVMRGTHPAKNLIYEGRLGVVSNGSVEQKEAAFCIKGATRVSIFYAAGTSYSLCPETFFSHKAEGKDPHEDVTKRLQNAMELGYAELRKRHLQDYVSLMGRVDLDLGGKEDVRYTDELLESYRQGESIPYLEELYFQYGRHLLVSSSRKGSLPASLQGVWTAHDKSPWGSGFWHNINIQMNYWPAFVTNLGETFDAYADFFLAYLPYAQTSASKWVQEENPASYEAGEGKCGWIIGTGAFAYEIEGMRHQTHSGPGTGGMTSRLFYDAYAFTLDQNFASQYVEPAVHGMAKFFVRCVKKYDDKYLCSYSASPEQLLGGHWVLSDPAQQYYHTVGCAFDEQMMQDNALNDLRIAAVLGKEDDTTKLECLQANHYDPVQIGYSGQIKEYQEEHFYGEIGEYHHRHLSQLVGLMPGSLITHQTPAWLDAAKRTLELRGNFSTGWALAHRLCCWARVGDGDHCYRLLRMLLEKKTHPNLWDVHPPFQIDGNFGATAGIAEMLLQSHEGYISLLPALPSSWKKVSFRGLKARGNFEISCRYEGGVIQEVRLLSLKGQKARIRYEGITPAIQVESEEGAYANVEGTEVSFPTIPGHTYVIKGFVPPEVFTPIQYFQASYAMDGVHLSWRGEGPFALYRAEGDSPRYQLLAVLERSSFLDKDYSMKQKGRLTYKVMPAHRASQEKNGALAFLSPASELEEDRYQLKIAVNNQFAEKIGWSEKDD